MLTLFKLFSNIFKFRANFDVITLRNVLFVHVTTIRVLPHGRQFDVMTIHVDFAH